MNTGNITTNALSGMQQGLTDMQDNARRIASGEDPVKGLVKEQEAAHQVEASAKAVKAGDDAIGKLLDEYA
jgi:hypothetical protein